MTVNARQVNAAAEAMAQHAPLARYQSSSSSLASPLSTAELLELARVALEAAEDVEHG